MIEHGVMQNHHSGARDRPAVNLRVQSIVPQMIECGVTPRGRHLDRSMPPQLGEQRRRIIRHAGPRRRESVRLRQLPQPPEISPGRLGIFAPGRHRHQPAQSQIGARPYGLDQGRHTTRIHAVLRLFLAQFDLQHDVQPAASIVQTARQFRRIHGLHHLE